MKPRPTDLRGADHARLGALVWFAVLAGPAAWAIQFLLGAQFVLAQCSGKATNSGFGLPMHAISVTLAGVGALVGVVATLVAFAVYRATGDDEHTQDPEQITTGRLRFLATVALTVNPLTTAICLMLAIGTPLLGPCQQS
jgi:hypothetical protein